MFNKRVLRYPLFCISTRSQLDFIRIHLFEIAILFCHVHTQKNSFLLIHTHKRFDRLADMPITNDQHPSSLVHDGGDEVDVAPSKLAFASGTDFSSKYLRLRPRRVIQADKSHFDAFVAAATSASSHNDKNEHCDFHTVDAQLGCADILFEAGHEQLAREIFGGWPVPKFVLMTSDDDDDDIDKHGKKNKKQQRNSTLMLLSVAIVCTILFLAVAVDPCYAETLDSDPFKFVRLRFWMCTLFGPFGFASSCAASVDMSL